MDVNVNVTVDLGDRTMSLLSGVMATNKALIETTNTVNNVLKKYEDAPKAVEAAPAPKPEPEKPVRTRRTKEQIAADEARTADSWDGLDDDAKLEAIKAEVTKHTKKGKSADIKALLSQFDARRASELNPDDYDAFFDAITRYGEGESVEAIFPDDID